jgi:CHASE2 domain-containing sensor protein
VVHAAGDQWLRRPAPSDLKVIVVDIDRASIDAVGPPGRGRGETMARLVEAVRLGGTPAWQLQRYSRDLGQRPGASSSR